MKTEPANEPDKQPRGKVIGAFCEFLAVVACGLSASMFPATSSPGIAALTREHGGWEQAEGLITAIRAEPGQVPCSGARRRGKALDEVSAAIGPLYPDYSMGIINS